MNWPPVLAAFGCLFVLGLLDNARGPLFPDVLRGLRLTDAEGAWLFAAASAAGGVGSLCGRWVQQRLGVARTLHLGLLLCASGMWALGGSTSFRWLVLGSTVFGLSFGVLNLVLGTLVQRGAPPAVQRRVFAGLHSMYGAASLLAPLAVLAAARADLDWRGSFRGLAFAPLALLVATLALRDGPETEAAPALVAPAAPPGRPTLREALVALMAALQVSAELIISTRLVLHLRRLGWSEEAAAQGLVAFFACLLLGRVLLGVVAVPWSNRAVLGASAGLSCLVMVLGLTLHPGLLSLAGLVLAPFFPTVSALVADEFPGAFERVMSLLLMTVSACVMLAHWVIGAVSDAHGLQVALWLAPACLVGALALAVGTRRPVRI